MDKREKLLEVALLSLSLGAAAASGDSAQAAPKKGPKAIECYGVNACRGTNGCAISPEQIAVANKVLGDKYTKSKPVDCAGNSDCSSKSGFLAWVAKATEAECFAAAGFILEKDAKGKIVVRDKSGVKS